MLLTPQFVVLAWIFGPLLMLSLARAALQLCGKPLLREWPEFLAMHAYKITRKMPIAVALAVVGFWI